MIEAQCNVLFISAFDVELGVKNERERVFRIWENVDPVRLFLSLSLKTVFCRKPPPIVHMCSLITLCFQCL